VGAVIDLRDAREISKTADVRNEGCVLFSHNEESFGFQGGGQRRHGTTVFFPALLIMRVPFDWVVTIVQFQSSFRLTNTR